MKVFIRKSGPHSFNAFDQIFENFPHFVFIAGNINQSKTADDNIFFGTLENLIDPEYGQNLTVELVEQPIHQINKPRGKSDETYDYIQILVEKLCTLLGLTTEVINGKDGTVDEPSETIQADTL